MTRRHQVSIDGDGKVVPDQYIRTDVSVRLEGFGKTTVNLRIRGPKARERRRTKVQYRTEHMERVPVSPKRERWRRKPKTPSFRQWLRGRDS